MLTRSVKLLLLRGLAFFGCLCLSPVWAQDASSLDLSLPVNALPTVNPAMVLASVDNALETSTPDHQPLNQPFKPGWITENKVHKYLGIGSLLLAGLTMITAPEDGEDVEDGVIAPPADNNPEGDEDLHQSLAYSALTLGSAAVATGFLYHWDDIYMDNGITDPDNLHMALGIMGTLGYATAVAMDGKDGHSIAGAAGGISMLAAIYIEW